MKIYCRRLEKYKGTIEIGGIYELSSIDGVMYWVEPTTSVRLNGKLPGIFYPFKKMTFKLLHDRLFFPFDPEQYEQALKSGIFW